MKKCFLNMLCSFALAISSNMFGDITSNLTHFTNLQCSLKEKNADNRTSLDGKSNVGRTLPHMPVDEGKSLNWSGYASATNLANPSNNTVTNIVGAWTVPLVKESSNNTYTSIWVGIDGYGSGTVEQLGTEHDWNDGVQTNYAWFEMYPNPSYQIEGFPLNVGDVIQAEVEYKGGNQFQLSIANHTQKVYTVIPAVNTTSTVAKRASAEWVVEAPYLSGILPLSDFQNVSFTNCSAVIDGVAGGIENARWQTEALTMENSTGATKAEPSALTKNDAGFSVKWFHE